MVIADKKKKRGPWLLVYKLKVKHFGIPGGLSDVFVDDCGGDDFEEIAIKLTSYRTSEECFTRSCRSVQRNIYGCLEPTHIAIKLFLQL